jgi:hypothetical protein
MLAYLKAAEIEKIQKKELRTVLKSRIKYWEDLWNRYDNS